MSHTQENEQKSSSSCWWVMISSIMYCQHCSRADVVPHTQGGHRSHPMSYLQDIDVIFKREKGFGGSSVVECFPDMHEALGSIPSTAKATTKEKRKKNLYIL